MNRDLKRARRGTGTGQIDVAGAIGIRMLDDVGSRLIDGHLDVKYIIVSQTRFARRLSDKLRNLHQLFKLTRHAQAPWLTHEPNPFPAQRA